MDSSAEICILVQLSCFTVEEGFLEVVRVYCRARIEPVLRLHGGSKQLTLLRTCYVLGCSEHYADYIFLSSLKFYEVGTDYSHLTEEVTETLRHHTTCLMSHSS